MRFILEGGSGSGKTTLARALRDITGVPIYRPFRGKDEHIQQSTVMAMQDLGLSVNGWQEDMYTADFLSVVHSDVIIDRSMPSAMAFDEVSSCALLPGQRRAVLRLWAERIVAARAILVFVGCAEATRVSRIEAARLNGDYSWETQGILKAIVEAGLAAPDPGLKVWSVDTTEHKPEILAAALARRLVFGVASPLIHDAPLEVPDVLVDTQT